MQTRWPTTAQPGSSKRKLYFRIDLCLEVESGSNLSIFLQKQFSSTHGRFQVPMWILQLIDCFRSVFLVPPLLVFFLLHSFCFLFIQLHTCIFYHLTITLNLQVTASFDDGGRVIVHHRGHAALPSTS